MYMFDAWLIESVEKVCHRFQRWTGLTNYFWLKLICRFFAVLILGILIYAFLFAHSEQNQEFRKSWINIILEIMGFFISFTMARKTDKLEKEAYARITKGQANPSKNSSKDIFIRFIFALQIMAAPIGLIIIACSTDLDLLRKDLPSTLMFIATDMFIWGLALLGYILYACDPLPPCNGTAKAWFRNLFLKPANT